MKTALLTACLLLVPTVAAQDPVPDDPQKMPSQVPEIALDAVFSAFSVTGPTPADDVIGWLCIQTSTWIPGSKLSNYLHGGSVFYIHGELKYMVAATMMDREEGKIFYKLIYVEFGGNCYDYFGPYQGSTHAMENE